MAKKIAIAYVLPKAQGGKDSPVWNKDTAWKPFMTAMSAHMKTQLDAKGVTGLDVHVTASVGPDLCVAAAALRLRDAEKLPVTLTVHVPFRIKKSGADVTTWDKYWDDVAKGWFANILAKADAVHYAAETADPKMADLAQVTAATNAVLHASVLFTGWSMQTNSAALDRAVAFAATSDRKVVNIWDAVIEHFPLPAREALVMAEPGKAAAAAANPWD